MKNVTDFRKTVETGVDPHLRMIISISVILLYHWRPQIWRKLKIGKICRPDAFRVTNDDTMILTKHFARPHCHPKLTCWNEKLTVLQPHTSNGKIPSLYIFSIIYFCSQDYDLFINLINTPLDRQC